MRGRRDETVAVEVTLAPKPWAKDSKAMTASRRRTSARAVASALVVACLLWPFVHASTGRGPFVHTSSARARAAPPGPPAAVEEARVFADLERRVAAVVAWAKRTPPPKDRLPPWASEARERIGIQRATVADGLPPWASACDLECRLASCSRPKTRPMPADVRRSPSAARAAYLGATADVEPEADWREHVEAAGVRGWRARHLAGAAKRGSPVPCVAPPFPDYIAGLREHLPALGAPRPPRDVEADALQQKLNATQERPCAEAVGLPSVGRMGIGGVLTRLMPALAWAAARGRPFGIKDPTLYHMFRGSATELWDVVERYSACGNMGNNAETYDFRPVDDPKMPNLHSDAYVPPAYAHRGHFWWTAQLMRFLFRPKEAARAAAAKELAKMGGRPFVGLHVRHGDKCRGDRIDATAGDRTTFRAIDDRKSKGDNRMGCASLTELMVHVQKLYELYGIQDVYLATDDADVVDRARRDPCYAHFTFHFQDYDRLVASDYAYFHNTSNGPKLHSFSLEVCQNAGEEKVTDARGRAVMCPFEGRDRLEETLTMMVDLAVLAKADAFVGSLWSNVGRVAYELSAAEKGCLPPVVSRDVGWCNMAAQIQDGSPWGHVNC